MLYSPVTPGKNGRLCVCCLIWLAVPLSSLAATPELRQWLETTQNWIRDTDGPIVSLGERGRFDDTHMFAPLVAFENNSYRLWYCGSTSSVAERVFHIGMATSRDGRTFKRYSDDPIFRYGDGKHSLLTPTLLRHPDGSLCRENGRLRMWFTSTWFAGDDGTHTLHESKSVDGIHWTDPSAPQLKGVYAPTIIKDGREYRMWFTDVSSERWVIRHASSLDGVRWRVTAEPCLVVDQEWEKSRLFYPTVLKVDGVYQMWYGSYWSSRTATTALGFAASLNGLTWTKHPQNPVLRPDPERPWESNYVTSQSIIRSSDGSYRIWYASRKKPPFVNKYFAINTAVWKPLAKKVRLDNRDSGLQQPKAGPAFTTWRDETRQKLRRMLGIPEQRVSLNVESRGQFQWDGIVIEKWVFTSETGSRVPAVLYRPRKPKGPMPAIVLTFGHGGSKSQWQYNYAGQLYARLGLACLAIDPIGEEERHVDGKLGTRAHDPRTVSERADQAGRLIMGKLVFDTMRGIDFLCCRSDIDQQRIGVAGNSLGGAVAGWMAALESRLSMAIVSGWAYHDVGLRTKYCTRLPNERMRSILSWEEYAALAAPNCAVLLTNGVYAQHGVPGEIRAWFEADGGHRPYFAYKESLQWIHRHLGTPAMTLDEIRRLPTTNSGQWCDRHGILLERLYGTMLHQRGATLPDLDLRPTPRQQLACLRPDERGTPAFTIEGWLHSIE